MKSTAAGEAFTRLRLWLAGRLNRARARLWSYDALDTHRRTATAALAFGVKEDASSYNHERFSMALRGRTPMEKLAAVLSPPLVMARSPDNVQ